MAAERVYASTANSYANTYRMERQYQAAPSVKDRRKVNVVFNSKTKKHTLTAVIAAGLFFVMLVVFTVFASHLAYANNQLQKENQDLANEVQSLKVDIKSAMNIGTIETAASEQLGMVYPTGSQMVTLEKGSGIDNLAAKLKAEAFN